jgi:hypothetical protein
VVGGEWGGGCRCSVVVGVVGDGKVVSRRGGGWGRRRSGEVGLEDEWGGGCSCSVSVVGGVGGRGVPRRSGGGGGRRRSGEVGLWGEWGVVPCRSSLRFGGDVDGARTARLVNGSFRSVKVM